MAGVWQRYYPSAQRAAAAAKRTPKKAKNTRVKRGGRTRRVNAPKGW